MKKQFKKAISGLLACAIIASAASCNKMSKSTVCLSESVKASSGVSGNKLDDKFISGASDFAINLLKNSMSDSQNTVISPLSVMLALSMTANGAKGETLQQMEAVLGKNDIDSLNKYLYTYIHSLSQSEKAKLAAANSIWIRDDGSVKVNEDFLQKNADYYSSDAYKAAFDDNTLDDINKWVYVNTDKQIKSILNNINPTAVMYLLNAITFDAEWDEIYNEEQVQEDDFHGMNAKTKVDLMHSDERRYLDDGKAVGFMKYYSEGYSYAILMPNEGITLSEYVAGLSGEAFANTLGNAKNCEVIASMPKFKSEYSIEMSDALKSMGMTDAFDLDRADFSGINGKNDLYIGHVLHKAVINVDEKGTKAGAATAVELKCEGAMPDEDNLPKIVKVNRPFVYAIVDNEVNLPIFIGTVTDL